MWKIFQKPEDDLSLANYKKIWTKFGFLDECGSLSSNDQPFFTVGILKLTEPYYLQSKLQYERQSKKFFDEMKFNKASKNNIEFFKLVIDSLLDSRSFSFYSYTLDKEGAYFQKNFGSDPWQAYEDISLRILEQAIGLNEILVLIADHVTTPKNIRFEVSVRRRVNGSCKRLALAGVCRFDSKSNDLLQVVDLIVGIVNYDLKMQYGLAPKPSIYKKELVDHFKKQIGVADFKEGFRSKPFNIFVDQDSKARGQ